MTQHKAMPDPFILPVKSAYASETFTLDLQVADMDMIANTFMRAPGESVGISALESAVDELADRLGIDPIKQLGSSCFALVVRDVLVCVCQRNC